MSGRAGRDEETTLLVAVGRGDVDALRKLYRIFERPLYSLGIRWLGDRTLAEELVQEVTVRVWRGADRFDARRAGAGSWIFGIARNVASDLARARARTAAAAGDLSTEQEPWDEDSAWEGWQVARAVRSLPEDQQKVLVLAYTHRLTHAEIAEVLRIPLGTVKTRLYQGLRKVRSILAERGVVDR